MRKLKNDVCPRDEIHTGSYHGGRVNQRAHCGGPAIASGSHTCKGNWADFPTAPRKIRMAVIRERAIPAIFPA